VRRSLPRTIRLILLVAASLALAAGALARFGTADDPTPTSLPGPPPTRESRPAACPGVPAASPPVAPSPAAPLAVGLDEANHRYTDPTYGWSVGWHPAAWPSGVWAELDFDGYPVLHLAAAPPVCTPWEPGFPEAEWQAAEQYWRVELRSTDAAHPEFRTQETGAYGPGDPAACVDIDDAYGLEIVTGTDGRPLREVTAERAWAVVQSSTFDTVTYRECRVLVPGVSLLAISGEISPAVYAAQEPVLDALLATIQIPAAGAWTPAAVPTPLPTATPVTRPIGDETLARLSMRDLDGSALQMRAGGTLDLDLGVVECCYFLFAAPVAAVWSVAPAEGATIVPGTGVLRIDPATPSGSVFTVTADVENGRRVIVDQVHVYTLEANPLVGYWREETQLACDTGAEVVPALPIGSLVFRADGTFSVTWMPFELYVDYWGTYTFDLARGTLDLVVEQGNSVPADADLSGTFAIDDAGRLVLTDLWLGTNEIGLPTVASPPADLPACGHRFGRPGSTVATPAAAATPDDATGRNVPRDEAA
jgi:hypothetical protein